LGGAAIEQPADVTGQTWADWMALRKEKRAPVTATVLAMARREAEKAAMPFEDFLQEWCARGSQGLKADWLLADNKPQRAAGRKPAPETFEQKKYGGGLL
jgi:hypothetical protein